MTDELEMECPECGAVCLVDDGNYVAVSTLPSFSAGIADTAGAKPIGKVLSDAEIFDARIDLKAGRVIWFGTLQPGYIYAAPPAPSVADASLSKENRGMGGYMKALRHNIEDLPELGSIAEAVDYLKRRLEFFERIAETGVPSVADAAGASEVTPDEYAQYYHGARLTGLKPYTFSEYVQAAIAKSPR